MSDEIQEIKDSLERGEMTTEQTWDYVKFAMNMGSGFSGYNTPQLANQTLIQLNNNPSVPTFDNILKALQEAPYSAETLKNYSEFMQTWDAIYQKTLRHFRGMLSFDYYMVCNNAPKDAYKNEEYQKDKKRAEKFMYSFNYKKEFDRVLAELLKSGQCYSWFRTNYGTFNDDPLSDSEEIEVKKQNKFSLQIMPQKYCMLEGYWQGGLNYAFNMQYFLRSGVDIKEYDPSLMKRYIDMYYGGNAKDYSASSQLYDRDGSFAQWTQVSSEEGAWAWLFDDSSFAGLPPFANMMKSVFNNDIIESLQKDKNVLSAFALLMGEMELMDKEKSGQKTDQFAISPEKLGQLLGFVKNSLNKSVKQIPLPLTETKYAQFTDNSPLMAQYQYGMSSSLGASASSMIYTNGKMAQFEMQSALLEDYALMKRLYLQFSDFINYFMNRKTKKYKFTIVFEGSTLPFEREARKKTLMEYTAIGMVPSESYYANVIGIAPHMFSRMREEANMTIGENLTMLMNANTMKNGTDPDAKEVGNQESDVNELSDSGEQSQGYN